MPLFIDTYHAAEGLTADTLASAHAAGLKTQQAQGVRFLRYWLDEGTGSLFCLIEAPSKAAAAEIKRTAHALVEHA